MAYNSTAYGSHEDALPHEREGRMELPRGIEYAGEGEDKSEMLMLLDSCRRHWERREIFRRQRRRSRNYYRGRQWYELVEDPDNQGEMISERALIERQGRVPWVMNHIQAVVRNLKGQYRLNRSDRAVFAVSGEADPDIMDQVNLGLRAVRRYNKMHTIEPDQFEEHLLSGASCFYVSLEYDHKLDRNEVYIEPVDQSRLFYNLDLDDRRMNGIRIIGRLMDLTRDEMLAAYAVDDAGNYSAGKAEKIRDQYANYGGTQWDLWTKHGFDRHDSVDFYNTYDTNRWRVVEVWCQKHELVSYVHDRASGTFGQMALSDAEIMEIEDEREAAGLPGIEVTKRLEPVWHVYHLTPYGDILFSQRSPYWHEAHPYVVGVSTLLDGETWGLVESVIDPQRWLNRITSMLDFSLAASAKGVLLIDEDMIPDDMSLDDFAAEWTKANGVVRFKPKPGFPIPQQIASNAIPAGAFEMLAALKQWIEETSGVTGPMQGFEPKSGTPASLYQQQVIQASTTNLDYFESFMEFCHEVDRKTLQVMLQGFAERRQINEPGSQVGAVYDPEAVRALDWDVALGDVSDTATYRQLFEADLQNFLGAGYLNFGTYLEMSSHPKAKQLLRVIQRDDPAIAEMSAIDIAQAMGPAGGQGNQLAAGQPRQAAASVPTLN